MQVNSALSKMRRIRYSFMNAIAPRLYIRWTLTLTLLLSYTITSPNILADLITYLIAFYLLTVAIKYFTPKEVAEEIGIATNDDEQLYSLDDSLNLISSEQKNQFTQINKDRTEDKPLVRSLCELGIWTRTTLAFGLGAVCSYFKMLQIDVFWPLLLLYFAGLALYTIFKILKTMDKYRYNLSDFKKTTTPTQNI